MAVIVTGAAGFIGYHVARALLDRGETVIGIDCVNEYYEVRLKEARLARLAGPGFALVRADVSDRDAMLALADTCDEVTEIVHLAAQAGVRQSLIDPYAFVTANVMGQLVLLELARKLPRLRHVVYASSSSVYGLNTEMPFVETQRVDRPSSLYAASKRAGELIAHVYQHLYDLPTTGLRFFTVYGPWGRPDMAYFSFARAIVSGSPITVYDDGRPSRDFTYIDDIVAGVLGVLKLPPAPGKTQRLLNIGNHRSETVGTLIELLEAALGRRAVLVAAARPAADVARTWASVSAMASLCGYAPKVTLAEGVERFVAWFAAYEGGEFGVPANRVLTAGS